jgi:hypothetical protein
MSGSLTKNGALFGIAKESNGGDAGVESIGSAVVDVTPGDYLSSPGKHPDRRSTSRPMS